MALRIPSLVETSNKVHKCKDYPKKAKDLSFFAFIFSIFIYISIFYIFNISPRSLVNKTNFWFFISNTLIFIIATDYGVFSSLQENHDLHEEYLSYTTQARNNGCSFVTQYPEMVKRSFPEEDIEISKESKKMVIAPKSVPREKVLEIVKSEQRKLSEDTAKMDSKDSMKIEIKEARKFSRNMSERGGIKNDKRGVIIRRSQTEKHESREDDNEFSTMSDEELNTRVEEFIQRFNRQIRLQRESNFNKN